MNGPRTPGDDETALSAPWSEREYLQWMREQEERELAAKEAGSLRIPSRFDPDIEAAVCALEENGWGRRR